MDRVLNLCFFLSLFGCNGAVRNPTDQDPNTTAVNNWSSSLDQIKKETLERLVMIRCVHTMKMKLKGKVNISILHKLKNR